MSSTKGYDLFNHKEKLRSLIDQAERLMAHTDDLEWKEDLRRSIDVFKKMLEERDKEEIEDK